MHYYDVAPIKIVRAGSDYFTYCSEQVLQIGQLVTIPVGKLLLIGIVIKHTRKPAYDTRAIASALDIPPLPNPLLKTALWMARYYATPLATTLQTILPRGLTKKRRTAAYSRQTISRDRTHYLLNKDQQAAVDTLTQRTNGTVLLHGVTGSGKTAVYITYAKHIMTQQKSVIILVPEIALTSQLIAEFEQHFSNILLTHSQQTESARHQIWLDALRSTIPRIAIGPRSALFLPLAHIGAIIIDEAHNILSYDSTRESQEWKDFRLETFEEIIKEGRKFGVFLTIASQRPSDISATIISQLHNYLIHRLINNRDLEMVEKAIAYLDKISIESLPILPAGACVLSGIIADLPLILQVDRLSEEEQPESQTIALTESWLDKSTEEGEQTTEEEGEPTMEDKDHTMAEEGLATANASSADQEDLSS